MSKSLEIEEMIKKARNVQSEYEKFSQKQVDIITRAVAKTIYDNAEELAEMAVKETRMGVYEHKVLKNRGKARIIWNDLKDKKSVGIISRNETTGITEVARPIGVVAAVTPCTNPIVTPMCNAMFALKGRNAIIFAPHPRAKGCAQKVTELLRAAISDHGAPEDLIQVIKEPTVELTNELMRACDVVVATGGMGMVKAAYSSGKPAYGVGAGNVQCLIDTDADMKQAVPRIIEGREFDNGIICSAEQTLILPRELYSVIISEFEKNGCFYTEDPDTRKILTDTIFPGGIMNKDLVGVSAEKIAQTAGIKVPSGTRVIIIKADGYGDKDLLSKEKMCPVMSSYSYTDFEEAVKIAQANLDVEGRGHSVSIHSNNREHIEYAAQLLTVSRLLINQTCATMNGGSFLNGLTPTTTLGCASWGGNSISENFNHKHLLNMIRIAYRKENIEIPSDDEIWSC